MEKERERERERWERPPPRRRTFRGTQRISENLNPELRYIKHRVFHSLLTTYIQYSTIKLFSKQVFSNFEAFDFFKIYAEYKLLM